MIPIEYVISLAILIFALTLVLCIFCKNIIIKSLAMLLTISIWVMVVLFYAKSQVYTLSTEDKLIRVITNNYDGFISATTGERIELNEVMTISYQHETNVTTYITKVYIKKFGFIFENIGTEYEVKLSLL